MARASVTASTRGRPARGRPATSRAVANKAVANKAASPAPKLSKEELRLQVEKLERANATLRAKIRALTRAAKETAGQLEELENQARAWERKAARAERKPGRRAARAGAPEAEDEGT